jgi:CubicO group peptidase (beta-lactamase class C family)
MILLIAALATAALPGAANLAAGGQEAGEEAARLAAGPQAPQTAHNEPADEPVAPEQEARRWTAFLHRQMEEAMRDHHLPNACLALVRDGEILLLQGYGTESQATAMPVDPVHSLFRTGSVSKVFTWTAVMQLAERGMLDLDADVNEYLDFTLPDRLYRGPKGETVPPVTLRHLMTHTAGFEDILEHLFVLDADRHLPLRDYVTRYLPARIYPPGEVMAYSNYGPSLAGYIVERVTGMPFEAYVRDHILVPLGMHSSSFGQPLHPFLQDRLVEASRMVDGRALTARFEYMPAPAGGLTTSAQDMALFMLAHLHGGSNPHGRILLPATTAQMHRTQFTHHPLLGGMAHGLMESRFNGQRVVFHAGSSTVFDAGMYLLPDQQTGLFIAYSGGSFQHHAAVFQAFMDAFFPELPEAPPSPPSPEAVARARQLSGEYQPSRRAETTGEKPMNLLSMVMRLEVDGEGFLLVNHLGRQFRFVETNPGIYRNLEAITANPFGPFNYLVAGTAPSGRPMLMTDGPQTYIRPPLHGSGPFALGILALAVVLALATLLSGAGRWLIRRIRRQPVLPEPEKRMARRVSLAHAAALVVLLLLMATGMRPDPVHLLPLSAFGEGGAAVATMGFWLYVVLLTALAMVWAGLRTWWTPGWPLRTRLAYGLRALSAGALAWMLWYYNLVL